MEKSRLVGILRTFSKKELRDFNKWLHSPVHNLRKDVQDLFGYLAGEGKIVKSNLLNKELIFKSIFPNEEFNDAKMRQSVHFLMNALENFLVYSEIIKDQVNAKTILASVYRKRSLPKSFQKAMNEAKKEQIKNQYKDWRYLFSDYLLEEEKYTYNSRLRRTTDMNLQEAADALDTTYLSNKLRQMCLMLSHQAVYKKEYEIGMHNEILKYVESKNFLEIPAIAIYYYSYKATTEKDKEHYFLSLKNQIEQNGHLFRQAEIRDIYLLAINYCIFKINEANKKFFTESFDIYKRGIETGILMENGILSHRTFLNIVLNGTYLKEYDWVAYFIDSYKEFLEINHRENMSNYCWARLHFEKGDFDKSMKLLSQFEYNDILMNLTAKTLLLKMYYQQEEIDALDSLLDSIGIYLRRKKVIGYHKSNYKNIIRFTKKLLKVTGPNKYREKLVKEINEANPLTEKAWLLKQLGEEVVK